MNEVRIIKRYQNRKLYDTYQSCYVTLDEIAQILRDGHQILVQDNKNQSDITFITLIQLLFDQEKKTVTQNETDLLKRVICSTGGTMSSYIRALETKLHLQKSTEEFGQNYRPQPGMSGAIETPSTLN